MAKITIQSDCGNSPKRTFLRDWQIACAEGNLDFITEHLTDDVTLQTIGKTTVEGKPAVLEAIKNIKRQPIVEWVIHTIITHGREGAVNGEIYRENGEVDALCEVYTFKSTKGNTLKGITSYVISVSVE